MVLEGPAGRVTRELERAGRRVVLVIVEHRRRTAREAPDQDRGRRAADHRGGRIQRGRGGWRDESGGESRAQGEREPSNPQRQPWKVMSRSSVSSWTA